MDGNIIGQPFDERVLKEISRRQKIHGSGLNNKRTPQQIQFLNNRNAWLKLASSVYILGENTSADFSSERTTGKTFVTDTDKDGEADGVTRLKNIGLQDTENFIGNQLAQKCVLFNSLSGAEFNPDGTFKKYNQRSGVTKSNSLWNSSNSYGLGGSSMGISPPPGLVDCSIECVNRGSIRKAKVSIKVYDKFQFELIELLYLRLGYTMMLEWGWDKYMDQDGNIQQVETTLIEDLFLSKNKKLSQNALIQKIRRYRAKYNYNYDGFFGKVTNFDWTFNPDGSYDISLDLITLGDVIETISAKNKVKALSADQKKQDIENSDGKGWLGINWNWVPGVSAEGVGEIEDSAIVGTAGDSQISYWMYQAVKTLPWADREEGLTKNGPLFSWEAARSHYDGLSWNSKVENYPAIDLPQYNYFMTLGNLMEILKTRILPLILSDNPETILNIECSEDSNICNSYPNLISFDPKVCILKPTIYSDANTSIEELIYPRYLDDLKDFEFTKGNCKYGRVMNIYINFEFIAEVLQQTDKEGELNLFQFLTQIVTGINKALGNIMKLEVVIKNDTTITIIDQNPIANLGLEQPESFEIYGFNTSDSGSSNFVTDFSFETNITPDLASQISIGATAQGSSTKNTDATAFSKWNIGLMDRTNPSMIDTPGVDFTTLGTKKQDEAWESGTIVELTPGVISKTKNSVINLVFGNKADSTKYSDNPDIQDQFNQYKNVTYEGVDFTEVRYGEFLTLASGVDIGIKTKEYVLSIVDDLKDIYGISAIQRWLYDESEQYSSNYELYLVRAFGGKVNVKMEEGKFKKVTVNTNEAQYTQMSDDFISQGHQSFNAYVNLKNQRIFEEVGTPSPKSGFIPIKVGITFNGMSGVLIYNGMKMRQNFLPPQYDDALKFIIDKVDHNISDNNWSTNIGTLAVPQVDNPVASPYKNMSGGVSTSGTQTFPANKGPIDPLPFEEADSPLLSDNPLRFYDNRDINGVPVDSSTYGREISLETAVSYMNANVKDTFRTWYKNMENGGYKDYKIYINAVLRPFSRSVELKEQNSKNAAPGKSVHNYAAGVDISVVDPKGNWMKKAVRDPWIEQGIVAEAEKAGLQWGGYFGGYIDAVHFYVQFNRDTALANAAEDNQGKPQRDWDTRNTNLS